MNADVVIIGAGPAGIFTALEMVKKGSKKKIIMVEKGQAVENRQDEEVRQLQALLPHHHRLLRRRCVFRRQAVPQL